MKLVEQRSQIFILFIVISMVFLISACQHNATPIADAGDEISTRLGATVELNGSGSHDPDGSPLEYQWLFTIVPDGSSPFIQSSSSAYAYFEPDLPGVYIVELMVFDGELYSAKDHVVVKVADTGADIQPPFPPVVPFIPGPPQYVGTLTNDVKFQSSADIPQDGEVVWEVVRKPNGAEVNISKIGVNEFSFETDTVGNYILQERLVVGNHTLDVSTISIDVVESRASITTNPIVFIDDVVNLKFGFFAPMPPMGETLIWEMLEKPNLSNAEISGVNQYDAKFVPDMPGIYEIKLTLTLPNEEPDFATLSIIASDQSEEVDHALLANTVCSSCHDGINATGKSVNHILSTGNCDSCHHINSWYPTVVVDHMEVIGTCVNCHNNVVAFGKNVNHIPSSDMCDACHSTQGYVPVIRVDHSQVLGTCVSCHNGVIATGKSNQHKLTFDDCIDCHSTLTWESNASPPIDSPIALDLAIEISSSAITYQLGELIKATATIRNDSNMDVQLYRFSSSASPLVIAVSGNMPYFNLSNPNDPQFDLPIEQLSTLKVGESITREVVWDQTLPQSGLVPEGSYVLKAFVTALEPGGVRRSEYGVKAEIMIEHPPVTLKGEDAVLKALEDLTVKAWYESNGSNITCRLYNQTFLVDAYTVTPIQTLVAVPESEISCQASLASNPDAEWNVFFKGIVPDDLFSYHVIIDAVSGELKLAMQM